MFDVHFGFEILKGFVRGELEPGKNREVMRHLLSGCGQCRELTQSAREHTVEPSTAVWQGNGAERRVSAREERRRAEVREREEAVAREREQAPQLYVELTQHPLERQFMLVANSPRFVTWGLCELLIDESWEHRFDDAGKTLELTQVAVVVAEGLDMDFYGLRLVQDLKARAWTYLANAHRIITDFGSAEEALEVAEGFLEQGTKDPLEEANFVSHRGALRRSQYRYAEALQLFDRALDIYRQAGDSHSVGTLLLQKGTVCADAEYRDEAIQLFRESLLHLDPERDLRLILAARHNMVDTLYANGELFEALSLLQEIRPLYAELGDRLNQLRLRWIEGTIAADLGQTTKAEAAFLECRNGLIQQGIGYDAAEVSLELATIYAEQNRFRELRQLAVEMFPIFQLRDMHREAMTALMLFQRAAAQEDVTVELVGEVLQFLRKARNDPGLHFEPSSS